MSGCRTPTAENRKLLGWLNIKAKLIIVLVTVSLVPLAIVGWYSLAESRESISREVFNHLISVRDGKKAQILRFFEKTRADIRVLAESSHIGAALDAFSAVVQDNTVDQQQYDYFESLEYGSSFRQFIKEYDYYDLMLVTEYGDIVYSTKREADFTQNILTGPLKETLLGKSLKHGLKQVVMTDFQIYAPSKGLVMAFLIAPIGEGSTGAVVLKMTNQAINNIMLERSGMGKTGEAYLVGADNLMRSNSFLDPVNRTVAASFKNPELGRVDTLSSKAALKGETGNQIILDYRGELVLSAYLPVKFGRSVFALMAEIDQQEAFAPIEKLQRLVIILALVVAVLMLVSAYLIANFITRPILSLTQSSIEIAGGDLDQAVEVTGDDELGVLSDNFNNMRLSIRSKMGEIEENHEALRQANEYLEQRVEERTKELADAYNVISGSINYASRIQRSVLPSDEVFSDSFGDHFVVWNPRDVVGGDIYWCRDWGSGTLVMLGDCTGHGVPGAFMTLISTGALDRAVAEIPAGDVNRLIQRMHQLVQKTLGQDGRVTESDDGLELGVCFIEPDMGKLKFAGARFDLFMVSNGNVEKFKGNRKGIGYREVPVNQVYDETAIVTDTAAAFYMTTDGAIDQIGETIPRSFGKKRFQELLLQIYERPMIEQRKAILEAITKHQGKAPRLDDIAIIGFRLD